MSSFQTSHDSDEGSLSYDALGYASIEFVVSDDGVSLVANADGLRSLAQLFEAMAERLTATDNIHLTPAMQLTRDSAAFVVSRRKGGPLPDGSRSADSGGDLSDD